MEKKFRTRIPPKLSDEARNDLFQTLKKNGVPLEDRAPTDSTNLLLFLSIVLPLALFVFLLMMFRRTRDQFMGGGFFPVSARVRQNDLKRTKRR